MTHTPYTKKHITATLNGVKQTHGMKEWSEITGKAWGSIRDHNTKSEEYGLSNEQIVGVEYVNLKVIAGERKRRSNQKERLRETLVTDFLRKRLV